MATREIASTSANYAVGDLLYASSTTQLSTLAIGSAGNVLATKSGVPAWVGGSSGSETSYTAGTPLFALYATSANTSSTNAEPFYVKSIMTGAGGYGGRARFHAYTNVALGTNFMALKAYTEFGSSGSISGLAVGLCAEILMPNAAVGGSYYPLELEYVAGGTSTSAASRGWIYMNNTGDADGDFDDNGVLFDINGLTAGSGNLYDTSATTATGDATLKIKINGTVKYLLVADDAS